MIKIQKKPKPQVLIDNEEKWTHCLLETVESYGGYSKIPNSERDKLVSHYRHKDIREALAESSHYKCAFCECKPGESGNIEIEHFEPKSIYPDLTFEWDNLLPSCRKCNEAKGDFDTRVRSIINPAKEDPEALLTYSFLRITPRKGSGEEEKAYNTIEICNLNSKRLYDARAKLMESLTEYFDKLKNNIELIAESDTVQKRKLRITKLKNSLDEIDAFLQDDKAYSVYCRWFIGQSAEYKEAKGIVLN